MQELDVVNDMLATVGVKPLSSLDDIHPFKARARRTLARRNRNTQARGWWFNEERATLEPDATTGETYIPNDAVNVRFDNPCFVERGRRVFNTETQSYQHTEPLPLEFVRVLPFEELPEAAAFLIGTWAVMDFQRAYDADNARARQYEQDAQEALVACVAEDIRQRRVNMIETSPRLLRYLANANAARHWGTNWAYRRYK